MEVPDWWMQALDQVMKNRAMKRVDLARLLIPKGLFGEDAARELRAAQVKVKRFLDGDNRTSETALAIRMGLIAADPALSVELPRFEFFADSFEEAKTLEIASADPIGTDLSIRRGEVLAKLVAGEQRLLEILDRHEQDRRIDSPAHGGSVRGRRSRPFPGTKATRRER